MSDGPSPQALATVAAWRRELIIEALDGAQWQAEGAIRMLSRGEDRFAADAIRRMHRLLKMGAEEMALLLGDHDRPAGVAA